MLLFVSEKGEYNCEQDLSTYIFNCMFDNRICPNSLCRFDS
jgi:hypothetical protein